MKRILLAFMLLFTLISLSACRTEKPNVPSNEAIQADVTADMYLYKSWREESQDGNRSYCNTFVVYSKDFYTAPKAEDVKYKSETGYEVLTATSDDVSVDIYIPNENTKRGTCAYIKIKSSEIIDTKKVYVRLSGATTYEEGIATKEDYEKVHGNINGWNSLLIGVSSTAIPIDDILAMQTSLYTGAIQLQNTNKDQYYCMSLCEDLIWIDNKVLSKIMVDPLSDSTWEVFGAVIIEGCAFANIDEGSLTPVELDHRLEPIYKIMDDSIWFGYQTVDGSDITEYNGEFPDAFTYNNGKTFDIVIKTGVVDLQSFQ